MLGTVPNYSISGIIDLDTDYEQLIESSQVGTAVGITASASDADATGNSVSYSLSSDAGGLFSINPSSGVVTLIGSLDYETAPSHEIIVKASSVDGTSSKTFTIYVTMCQIITSVSFPKTLVPLDNYSNDQEVRHYCARMIPIYMGNWSGAYTAKL